MTKNTLFDPCRVGALALPNRIVMAPMTRCRTTQPGDVLNAHMAAYYAQPFKGVILVAGGTT